MRRVAFALFAVAVLSACAVLANAPQRANAQGPPQGGGPGGRTGGRPGGMMAMPPMPGVPPDSSVAERDSMIKVVLEDLGDKADAPAESVFHNLKVIKGRSARQVLDGMNGMAHSLGVSCRFCHVAGHWRDDDKKPKETARVMMEMTTAMNEQYMSKLARGDDHPRVGCFTCHRGEREPFASARRMMRGPGGPGGPGGEHRDGDQRPQGGDSH